MAEASAPDVLGLHPDDAARTCYAADLGFEVQNAGDMCGGDGPTPQGCESRVDPSLPAYRPLGPTTAEASPAPGASQRRGLRCGHRVRAAGSAGRVAGPAGRGRRRAGRGGTYRLDGLVPRRSAVGGLLERLDAGLVAQC